LNILFSQQIELGKHLQKKEHDIENENERHMISKNSNDIEGMEEMSAGIRGRPLRSSDPKTDFWSLACLAKSACVGSITCLISPKFIYFNATRDGDEVVHIRRFYFLKYFRNMI
jgi:hypothetical protein